MSSIFGRLPTKLGPETHPNHFVATCSSWDEVVHGMLLTDDGQLHTSHSALSQTPRTAEQQNLDVRLAKPSPTKRIIFSHIDVDSLNSNRMGQGQTCAVVLRFIILGRCVSGMLGF
jgi:hypothetical protein